MSPPLVQSVRLTLRLTLSLLRVLSLPLSSCLSVSYTALRFSALEPSFSSARSTASPPPTSPLSTAHPSPAPPPSGSDSVSMRSSSSNLKSSMNAGVMLSRCCANADVGAFSSPPSPPPRVVDVDTSPVPLECAPPPPCVSRIALAAARTYSPQSWPFCWRGALVGAWLTAIAAVCDAPMQGPTAEASASAARMFIAPAES
mmetsp:Transcript_34991/g.87555  ORF Transcript_34991/g.87555 Transcript_34991/m.87555 type:complete len:201 (+) Transcript_34991:537-1139(+)